MLMLIAAAAAQTSDAAARSSSPDAAVVSIQPVSQTGIGSRIVATPLVPSFQERPARVVVPVHIRVTAGPSVLFNDTLRVAAGSGASYSENRSEGSLTTCPSQSPYDSADRTSLSLNLYLRDNPTAGQAVSLSVNWQRPAPGGSCGNDGTRSVQLGQTVQLDPGESATIEGDAGLVVTLTRR